MNTVFPREVESCLWSYDPARLDVARDKEIIIRQVLDAGTKPATDWLRSVYSEAEIGAVIADTPASAWRSRKSLALWSLVYGTFPRHSRRVFA